MRSEGKFPNNVGGFGYRVAGGVGGLLVICATVSILMYNSEHKECMT